jgi:Gpi18-like mannosyltransferase
MALLPLSYFFAAPMSESVYLAFVLGVFYFGAKDRWALAALCGFLATLARSQGALLLLVASILLLEKHWQDHPSWLTRIRATLARGWVLVLIPLGALLFSLYRAYLQLPPIDEVYARYSFVFFVNPLEGILANLRWIARYPAEALRNIDTWAIVIFSGLAFATLAFKKQRRLPLLVYTFGYLLIFISKLNWRWGTNEVIFTQSFARYCLALFPLTVMIADGLRHARFWGRLLIVFTLGFGLVAFSGLYVFALTGP